MMASINEINFEKNLIINNRLLKYSGIFRTDELFSALNRVLQERGYEKREKKTEELVTENGRKTIMELRPYKQKSNYVTLMIRIKITLDHVTEVVEEVHGEKRKFQQGDVEIVFDAWSLTDYEHRWGMKPWAYFLKGVINRWVYKFPLEAGFTGELAEDTAAVDGQLKRLLNSYKEEVGKFVREEDVRKKVETEVATEVEESENKD